MSLLKVFSQCARHVNVTKDTTIFRTSKTESSDLLWSGNAHEVHEREATNEGVSELERGGGSYSNDLNNIGKGSMYQKVSRMDHMKALGSETSSYLMKRQFAQHTEEIAKTNYIRSVQLKELDSVDAEAAYNANREEVEQIIALLVELTPVEDVKVNDPVKLTKRKLSRNVFREVPPAPRFCSSPKIFEEYIHLITHSTFHYKQSSGPDGIIPKILNNLFHPLNSKTLDLRTVDSYNDILHYYKRNSNIIMVQMLFCQMELENKLPNTTTFNIMLSTLIKLKKIRHISSPYNHVLKYLTQMKQQRVSADLVTWNIVFVIFETILSKQLLLEKRQELKLPTDKHLISSTLNFLVNERQVPVKKLLEILNLSKIPLDPALLDILIKATLNQKESKDTWKLGWNMLREAKTHDIKPSANTLNIFLSKFSEKGRVDLVLAAMNTFKRFFKIQPDNYSYNLLFKSFSRKGFWNEKLPALKACFNQMHSDLNGHIAGKYWLTRLRARYKFVYGEPIVFKNSPTSGELSLIKHFQDFHWVDGVPIFVVDESTPEEYKTIADILGYRTHSQPMQEDEQHRRKRKQMEKYRQNIHKASIFHNSLRRIPYTKDQYGALKKELKDRALIE